MEWVAPGAIANRAGGLCEFLPESAGLLLLKAGDPPFDRRNPGLHGNGGGEEEATLHIVGPLNQLTISASFEEGFGAGPAPDG